MPGEEVDDLVPTRVWTTRQEILRRHQDAGGTEPALQRVVPAKGNLQRRQVSASGQPLDRAQLAAVHLNREQEAATHRGSVHDHRAGAADAVLAADVRPGETQAMPKEVRQQQPRLHRLDVAAPVDRHVDGDHAASSDASAQAARSARSTMSAVSSRRYAPVAWSPSGGSTTARAAAPASRARSSVTTLPSATADAAPTRSGRSLTAPTATLTPVATPSRDTENAGRHRERVVAGAERELGEPAAGPGRPPVIRPARLDHELRRLERRREVRDEEVLGGDLPRPRRGRGDHGTAGSNEGERQLRARVGVGERPRDRSAVARDDVADVREAAVAERGSSGERGLPDERATREQPSSRAIVVKFVNTIDVYQDRRTGQAHVEERDEALPAGEHLCVVAVLGQQVERPRRATPAARTRTAPASCRLRL